VVYAVFWWALQDLNRQRRSDEREYAEIREVDPALGARGSTNDQQVTTGVDHAWTSAPTLGERVKALVDAGDEQALRAALELVYDAIDARDAPSPPVAGARPLARVRERR